MARAARAARLPALITVSMARPSELEGRLLALLDERRVPGRLGARPAAAGALGALALVATALALAIVVENMLNRRMRLNEVLRLGEEDG
jgi:hypothetical protein